MRILIIEDETKIAEVIKSRLEEENYIVDTYQDGEEGLYNALTNIYDLIILDVMLPKINGFEILEKIKKEKIEVKVIMLTAKAMLEDKLTGLNSGANDYITKPFHIDELVARVNVQLRANDGQNQKDSIEAGDLKLNTKTTTLSCTKTNETIEAKASEGIVIEGANTVSIENCKLTDSNTSLNGQSTTYKNIFLYQSMSGDASNGTAKFTAKNSQITTNKGDTFYITNTTATIDLNGNTIINNDSKGNFLRAQKDSWGTSGSNGGKVTLKMTNQKANGNIVIDSISTLDMEMSESSYYEGTINGENQAKSITLKLDSSSKIKLTGDTYVTSLEDADTSYSNIDFNGYTLYVNGTAIN